MITKANMMTLRMKRNMKGPRSGGSRRERGKYEEGNS
jgi:hypothetical protein